MKEQSYNSHLISESNKEKLNSDIPRENEITKNEESISTMKQISPLLISKKFCTKYKNEELNKFKDEILSFLKERDNYFFSKINSYQSHIETTERKYENLAKIIKLNYQEILSSQANINNRLDKLNTYEQFASKTNDNLTSHEIRINNLREEFSKATHKYDKIYLDNLELVYWSMCQI
jgi:DNA repair ATPase RecN